MTRTALYRHYSRRGTLLYVGISVNAVARLSAHRTAPWFGDIARVTVEQFPSRAAAVRAERAAIRLEKPRHNKAHNGTRRKLRKDTLGERLRHERARLGLATGAFAKVGGVTGRTQQRYERGARCPSAKYVGRIAGAGANVLYVLGLEGPT